MHSGCPSEYLLTQSKSPRTSTPFLSCTQATAHYQQIESFPSDLMPCPVTHTPEEQSQSLAPVMLNLSENGEHG